MRGDSPRERLEIHLTVALATTPKHVWKHFWNGTDSLMREHYQQELAQRMAETILNTFDLTLREGSKSSYDR